MYESRFDSESVGCVFTGRCGWCIHSSGVRRRNGLCVGSGGEVAGDCWISGTQISPSCEAGHNEKMGLGVEETGVAEWERKWTKMWGGGNEKPRYKKGRSELYIAPGYRRLHSRTRSIRRTL